MFFSFSDAAQTDEQDGWLPWPAMTLAMGEPMFIVKDLMAGGFLPA